MTIGNSEETSRGPAHFSQPASRSPGASWELMISASLWGTSDNLTARLDGNQEAPPRDTNAGSAHRITSLHLLLTLAISPSPGATPCFHSRSVSLFLLRQFPLCSVLVFCNTCLICSLPPPPPPPPPLSSQKILAAAPGDCFAL